MKLILKSTVEQVCDLLRMQILDGVIAPGEALREIDVASRLGISRNTLREAFQRLMHEGLLRRRPNRGVTVASPSVGDVQDIFKTRIILEPAGLIRLASAGEDALGDLRQKLSQLERDAKSRDWVAFGESEAAFHTSLVDVLECPRLSTLHAQCLRELRLVFIGIDRTGGRGTRSHVVEHRRIVELLRDRRDQEADAELRAHLERSEAMVVDFLKRSEEASPERNE